MDLPFGNQIWFAGNVRFTEDFPSQKPPFSSPSWPCWITAGYLADVLFLSYSMTRVCQQSSFFFHQAEKITPQILCADIIYNTHDAQHRYPHTTVEMGKPPLRREAFMSTFRSRGSLDIPLLRSFAHSGFGPFWTILGSGIPVCLALSLPSNFERRMIKRFWQSPCYCNT